MDQTTKKEFEKLARITQGGFNELRGEMNKRFEQVDKHFEQVDKRFEQVDGRLDNIGARLLVIERDVAEIRSHFVYRSEFEDLMSRVFYIEKKLKIKSGK